jgi:hypothetical protein
LSFRTHSSECTGSGRQEVLSLGQPVAQQGFVNQAVLLRWEDVGAKIEIVPGMVNQLERQHGNQPLQRAKSDYPQAAPETKE